MFNLFTLLSLFVPGPAAGGAVEVWSSGSISCSSTANKKYQEQLKFGRLVIYPALPLQTKIIRSS